MLFNYYDFDSMREYVLKLPAIPSVRKLRLTLFDAYRYNEEYEKLFALVESLGGKIL